MSAVTWIGPTNALIMQPESGSLEASDRIRITDVYKGSYALASVSGLARGTFGTGFRAGWVVNQCVLTREHGGIGKLVITWEAGGTGATNPLPVGNFSLEPQELYPKIERAGVFQGINFATINAAYNALYSGFKADGTPVITADFLTGDAKDYSGVTDATQRALALKLLAKLQKGEETFYITAWRYSFELFSYTEPLTSKGGVTGTPTGPLSFLPSNVAWLRLADKLEPAGVSGSMYKLTVTWLGGPVINGVGYWDADVYV